MLCSRLSFVCFRLELLFAASRTGSSLDELMGFAITGFCTHLYSLDSPLYISLNSNDGAEFQRYLTE